MSGADRSDLDPIAWLKRQAGRFLAVELLYLLETPVFADWVRDVSCAALEDAIAAGCPGPEDGF